MPSGGRRGDRRERRLELELDLDEDFVRRARFAGTADDVLEAVETIMLRSERAEYRRRFFTAAHWLVFGVAALSIAGMAVHFLNIRPVNTTFLAFMGSWTVGSIIYLYLVVVRDAFGVNARIPRPPAPKSHLFR